VRRCSVITHVQYPGGARFCSSPSTMTFLSQAGDFASQPFDWFAFCHKTILLAPVPILQKRGSHPMCCKSPASAWQPAWEGRG
jgi:hypothetical protein